MDYQEIKAKYTGKAQRFETKKQNLLARIKVQQMQIDEIDRELWCQNRECNPNKGAIVQELQDQQRRKEARIKELQQQIDTLDVDNTETKQQIADKAFKNWKL